MTHIERDAVPFNDGMSAPASPGSRIGVTSLGSPDPHRNARSVLLAGRTFLLSHPSNDRRPAQRDGFVKSKNADGETVYRTEKAPKADAKDAAESMAAR